MSRQRIEGWPAFFGWFFVGVLSAFAFVAALSIGGLALPFVVILAGVMIWARPPGHSLLGLVAGAGVLVLLIGVLHLGDTPCDEDGVMVIEYADESEASCGGFSAAPWIAIGSALTVAGTGLFAWQERRRADSYTRRR